MKTHMEMHQPKTGIQDSQPQNAPNEVQGERTVSIIGAGVMGRGIAAACLRAGISVRISDLSFAAAKEAVDQIVTDCDSRARQYPRLVDPATRPLISLATEDEEVADADLIIEAVPEDFALKTAILARIEPHLQSGSIMASNSSSLSITRLSAALQAPGQFCGMHFCHPVNERPLVEVVHTHATTNHTIRRAAAFATSLRLAPILIRDSPGFLLNRLLLPYMNEAVELLLDGAAVEFLDEVALDFGMPVGPFALYDEFGIDVALAVGRTLYQAYPNRIVPSELIIRMYKSGRLGRKCGQGFYSDPWARSDRQLSPEVRLLVADRWRGGEPPAPDTVRHRLILPMLLEATRAIEEQLVDDPAIIDNLLRDGLGMTQRYPGLFAWARSVGSQRILQWLEPLEHLGERFKPTETILSGFGDTEKHRTAV